MKKKKLSGQKGMTAAPAVRRLQTQSSVTIIQDVQENMAITHHDKVQTLAKIFSNNVQHELTHLRCNF